MAQTRARVLRPTGTLQVTIPVPYHPPEKRSVRIAGHRTSISLEPIFWEMLKAEAARAACPINHIVARIDLERIKADNPPGLASAIRVWLVSRLTCEDRDTPSDQSSTRSISAPTN